MNGREGASGYVYRKPGKRINSCRAFGVLNKDASLVNEYVSAIEKIKAVLDYSFKKNGQSSFGTFIISQNLQ